MTRLARKTSWRNSSYTYTTPARRYQGCCIIDTDERRHKALTLFPVEDVWGIDNLRHNKTVNLFAQDPTLRGEAMTEEDDEASFREEFYRRLFKVIDSMPPRQRAVFVAAMEGKSNKEIALELGVSVDTVKTQKKRGMKTLREEMSDGRMAKALNLLLLYYIITPN